MSKFKNGFQRALNSMKRELLAEAYRREADEKDATFKDGFHAGIETAHAVFKEFIKRAERFDSRFEREVLQRYFYGD